MVVVIEVGFGECEDSLGLKRIDEGGAQVELETALEVLVLRRGDLRAFFGALEAQLAFVVALMEVAERGYNEGALKGLPNAVVGSNLGAIYGLGELRVGTQICGGFFGAQLVHVEGVSAKGGIIGFKAGLYLVPVKGLLGTREGRNKSGENKREGQASVAHQPGKSFFHTRPCAVVCTAESGVRMGCQWLRGREAQSGSGRRATLDLVESGEIETWHGRVREPCIAEPGDCNALENGIHQCFRSRSRHGMCAGC